MKRLLVVVVLAACKPTTTTATNDASVADAAPRIDASSASLDAAPEAAASTPKKEPKKRTFAAKATGSFDGVVWRPTYASASVRGGDVTLAIQDGAEPKCTPAFGDSELQFLVHVPYVAGKKVDVSKLKRPTGDDRNWDFGEVSLFSLYKKNFAKTYTGTIELTSTPKEEDELVHVKIDIRVDATTLRGEFDAQICMYEE